MTARTRCGWVMFRECDELLYKNVYFRAERSCLQIIMESQQLHSKMKHGA